jgi:FAD/FMN-containing dehydrogenase
MTTDLPTDRDSLLAMVRERYNAEDKDAILAEIEGFDDAEVAECCATLGALLTLPEL